MRQSYKIYINQVVVILAQHKQVFNIPKRLKKCSIYTCNKEDEVKKLITALEIESINHNLIILSKDLDWLYTTFISNFKIISAGGGLVLNKANEILMIFRKGKWDLAKGKIEKKEDIQEGAIREVTEETGVHIKQVINKMGSTYHSYKLKDKWVLKETHWYLMVAKSHQDLVPQTEEDIEEVLWVKLKDVNKKLKNSYPSIQDVFEMHEQYLISKG